MKEQIMRIPIKYWELFNTMNNEDCWKLMKALFIWNPEWLKWITLTYFNIIIIDINNIQAQVDIWRKGWLLWWRPKNKGGVIETKKGGLWKTKPNIKESNINKDNINKDNIKESKNKYWEYKHILLSEKEYKKLITDYWLKNILDFIKRADEYIQQTWKKYKDFNLLLRNWLWKDKILPKSKISEIKDIWF